MEEHGHDLCAGLQHYVATMTLAYCQHRQHWILVVTAGDDQDDQRWRSETLPFGPFDGREDVLGRAHSELERLLRADLEGWLAQRPR